MAEQELLARESKGWKFKAERVAKGFVRITINSDDADELILTWKRLYIKLEEMGERVEKVDV